MFDVDQTASLTGSVTPISQSWISICIILRRIVVGSENFIFLERFYCFSWTFYHVI